MNDVINIKPDSNESITINNDYKISIDADGSIVVHSVENKAVRVINEPKERHTGIEEVINSYTLWRLKATTKGVELQLTNS